MDSEKLFIAGIVIMICTLILSITTYNMQTNSLVAEVVKSGVDPISARCGFEPRMDICIINETQSK